MHIGSIARGPVGTGWGAARALVPVVWVIGWVLGVAGLVPQPALVPPPALRVLMGLGLLIGVMGAWLSSIPGADAMPRRRAVVAWALPLAAFCSAVLLGHGSTGLRAHARLDQRLAPALEGQTLLVVGVVAELARRTPQGNQFILQVESARMLSGEAVQGVPPRVWLGWWREGHIDDLLAAAVPEPRPGERWVLPVRLKRPHGTQNPGGFDAERWFLEQHLGASGSVSAAHRGDARLLGHAVPMWRHPEGWRAAVRARIDAHVEDPTVAGLVAGLTIGDQSAVDAADWQLFRDAGVAHALSISGLHITLFATLAAPAVAWCWRRSARACLWWPAPYAGAVAGWCCALAYALLAGWGLPAQRTMAMLAVVTVVRLLRLNWSPMWVWWLAAGPVVVLDPWAVTQAGFWLSFAAVGLLLLSGGHADGATAHHADSSWLQRMWMAVRTQLVTALGLAPLAAACFGQVSVIGVVGNLVALPWITLLLTPLCLLGVVWPSLWALVPWVVDPLRGLMAALVSVPGAVVNVPGAPAWALALAMGGAVLALMNLPMRLRWCGVVLMMPHLLPPVALPGPGRFEVWAFDVGQGSAVLVRTQGHSLLMDAGPAWGEGRDAGERVVVPVLRHLGVRRLNRLVITHRDLDHAGGAAAVRKAFPVDALLSSLEATHPLRRGSVPHQACRRGQVWWWDGVRFEVLHPFGTEDAKAKPNHLSCVLKVIDAHGQSVLITGDIERDQESALVAVNAASAMALKLNSQALVVPHHGSRTSSTAPFLQAVQAQWAIAQAGYRNRFGHPAPAVVQALSDAGVTLEASPTCGAWRWDGRGPPQCWRRVQPRHWHDTPGARAGQ